MAVSTEDRDRKVVPRWRAFRDTLARRELSALKPRSAIAPVTGEALHRRVMDWQRNRSLSFAADLICGAIVLGRQRDAKDAAEFVTAQIGLEFPLLRHAAQLVLNPSSAVGENEQLGRSLPPSPRGRVHSLRERLHEEPRNAFLWTDLGLTYETLGLREQASRAIRVALALAPANRFVLRSCARLYVHHDELRAAHDLLRGSARVGYDPWLLSAEIAIASAARRTSRLLKCARTMLDQASFSPFHLSELASAIATLELEAGKVRVARRLFERSLAEPSENAVAQAAWAARRFGVLDPTRENIRRGPSSEARAWVAFQLREWTNALQQARQWLHDEPFSSRPAMLGSYIAAVCTNDYRDSLGFAELGLKANPEDFTLLNNKTVALAHLGDVVDARQAFGRVKGTPPSTSRRVVWLATDGLLYYREGNPETGCSRYREALQLAKKLGDLRLEASARLHHALEEVHIGAPGSKAHAAEALEFVRKANASDLDCVAARLRDLASDSG